MAKEQDRQQNEQNMHLWLKYDSARVLAVWLYVRQHHTDITTVEVPCESIA